MSEDSTTVTASSAFKSRSLAKQVLFSIVTLGFYWIYWYHTLHKQLAAGTDADINPTMATIGLFVPVYNLIVIWRTSHHSAAVTDSDGVLLFVLSLVFAPAFWYLVQSGINDLASGGEAA